MFKSTKVAERVCQELLKRPSLNVASLKEGEVPKHKGIYLWRERGRGKVVYVGVALGKKGLRQRIVAQHLNPNYRVAPEKESSVLRKAIVEQEHVPPCMGCVEWMKRNLLLSFWPQEEAEMDKLLLSFWPRGGLKRKDVIFRLAEKILIAEKRPRYNKEWKSEQELRKGGSNR